MKSPQVLAIVCSLLIAGAAQAQRSKSDSKVVPPNLRPPAGMCRVWLDGVPPGRQPAPTDCRSALRNRPTNGRVIFGDDYAHPDSANGARSSERDRPLKGVAPLPKSMTPKAADSTSNSRPAPNGTAKRKATPKKGGGHRPDSTSSVLPPGIEPTG